MLVTIYLYGFFFFQAEDGIRDDLVTGVQTCALPIYALEGSCCGANPECAQSRAWKARRAAARDIRERTGREACARFPLRYRTIGNRLRGPESASRVRGRRPRQTCLRLRGGGRS